MAMLRVAAGLFFLSVGVASAQSPGSAGRAPSASTDEAEILQIDQKIADAVVRGDTAFVDSMLAVDFSMVHGDQWTTGGKPLLTDDKESFLRRVTSKSYKVIAFDSVKAEMHGNLAITYGRYVATTATANDPSRAWFSVWFERVFAKRDGRWVYLSHRTVHGPNYGPDRNSVSTNSPSASSANTRSSAAPRSVEPVAAESAKVLALERDIGHAIVGGDAAYFDRVTAPDFVMTHGDAWTRGGPPALVDDEQSFMKRVASRSYAVHDFVDESVNVEMHGDVALTYGRYIGHIPSSRPERAWFSVWYLKVYEKRGGQWIYVSHRTVRGAKYGLDRASVQRHSEGN